MTPKRITRRYFLLLGGGTTLGVFIGGAYLKGGCPLSDSRVCVGPCAAFVDRNQDQICDRIQDSTALAAGTAPITAQQPSPSQSVACPFGLVDDPYPGKCRHYVDKNGNGICDLSEIVDQEALKATRAPVEDPAPAEPSASTPTPQAARVSVACPFGLVNDPYPGVCRRYVDKDGNGICDLSEIIAEVPAEEDGIIVPETGKRRQGQGRHRGSGGS